MALPPVFDAGTLQWESRYFDLPVVNGNPVLLVPKMFVRYEPAYQAGSYYNHYVLDFLQAEALNAGSALVRMLKNGRNEIFIDWGGVVLLLGKARGQRLNLPASLRSPSPRN